MATFPTNRWVQDLMVKLNTDIQYAEIAQNWEGDIRFVIEPEGPLSEPMIIYLDLWHGKCRDAYIESEINNSKPAFVLKGRYGNITDIIEGKLDPMQAMLTRKLNVQGNMIVLMRNVPTVLDFVRCCREVTDNIL